MVTRIAGMCMTRKVPARSSSSTLLSGSSASPNPASTIRFCAVRLSIGMISAGVKPLAASRCCSDQGHGS